MTSQQGKLTVATACGLVLLLTGCGSSSSEWKWLPTSATPSNSELPTSATPSNTIPSTPEPSDDTEPGGGEGPIVVGDCVYPGTPVADGPFTTQYINEIPCAAAAQHQPAYKVTKIDAPAGCPDGTALSFVISSFDLTDGKLACAVPV